jgi:hypothetical protein
MLHHLLDRSRILGAVLRPLFSRGWRCLCGCLRLRGLGVGVLCLNRLLLHLRVLRIRGWLLVRLLVGLLVGLLVRLRVRLVWLLALRLDVRLLHLAEVELVGSLGLRRCLCLRHRLLESWRGLGLRCTGCKLGGLWLLDLLLLLLLLMLLIVVVVEVAATLSLSVTSATATLATSSSTSTTPVISAATAAPISVATLLRMCA